MIKLTRYPTREKSDVIEWDGMPGGKCDMNFRPINPLKKNDQTMALIVLVTVLSAAIGAIINSIWPLLATSAHHLQLFVLPALLLLILIFAFRIGKQSWSLELFVVAGISVFFLIAINAGSSLFRVVLLSAFFLSFVFPSVFRLADSVATHNVYWFSAKPRTDLKTLTAIRQNWSYRFRKVRSIRKSLDARHLRCSASEIETFDLFSKMYRYVAVGTCVILFVVLLSTIQISSARQFPFILLFAILLTNIGVYALTLRMFQMTSAVFWKSLRHFVEYHRIVNPPWVFQSPCGPVDCRRAILLKSLLFLVAFFSGCWIVNGDAGETTSFGASLVTVFFQLIVIAIAAMTCFYCLVATLAAPALWVHYRACESSKPWLSRKNWSEFDCYQDRLANSSNPVERESVWVGFHLELEFPLLISIKLIREHVHLLGATGSGKTGLGLTTLVGQLIKRGDGPVIVVDCQGDRSLFHSCRLWAAARGVKFKWFTTCHNKSTYIFNPWDQKYLQNMTLQELVGLFLLSFNLHHGDDYGRAWFAAACKAAFMASMAESREKRPFSFRDFQREVEKIMAEHDEFKSAFHLMFVMQSLAQFEQLNLSPKTSEHPAYEHAIHMPEVIEQKQVIYFNLESLTDPMSAGEISRLVTYSAVSAAQDYKNRTGRLGNVYLVIDEAQNVIAKNISNVLAQARSKGLCCVLSHQTRSQLNPPGGVDLREVVENCTCVKQYFSARDPDSRKYLSSISGEVGYYDAKWQQFVHRLIEGDVGLHRAVHYGNDKAIAAVSEKVGPRLTDNDISEINHQTNRCAIAVERYEGFSRFRGAFPVHVDYPISARDYAIRSSRMRWPSAPDETIEIEGYWPQKSEETVVARQHTSQEWMHQALSLTQLDELGRKLGLE